MPSGGIRTHNLSRRVAADLRLIPRGHRDRRPRMYSTYKPELLPRWTVHTAHWSVPHLTLASQFLQYKLKSTMRLNCITLMPNIVRMGSNFFTENFHSTFRYFHADWRNYLIIVLEKVIEMKHENCLKKQVTFHLLCGLLLTCSLENQDIPASYISPVCFPLPYYFLILPSSPLPIGTLLIPIHTNQLSTEYWTWFVSTL
jgi:hypothetical protein